MPRYGTNVNGRLYRKKFTHPLLEINYQFDCPGWNVGTLITLLVGIILIGIQVRLEEEYLTQVHGDKYIECRRSVRRWI